MFAEDDLLPISALQHLLFCERQCALIHIERLWAENRLTIEGQYLHKRAHKPKSEWQDQTFIARGLRLRSLTLGIWGQSDIVEFTPPEDNLPTKSRAPKLTGKNMGDWSVVPVEYKRGKPKLNKSDEVQLCAQALCLEEMLETSIPQGAIFYGKRKRRTEIPFDASLRQLTIDASVRLQRMFSSRVTPLALREKKCEACSLIELCLPIETTKSAAEFNQAEMKRHLEMEVPLADPLNFTSQQP